MPRVRVRYFIDILWLWHHTIKYYIQKLNYIFNCSMVFCDSYFCNISKSPICHGVFSRLRQQKFWMSQYGYNRKNPWYQHRQFSTTEPIFTKILHNIAALVALLNHAFNRPNNVEMYLFFVVLLNLFTNPGCRATIGLYVLHDQTTECSWKWASCKHHNFATVSRGHVCVFVYPRLTFG